MCGRYLLWISGEGEEEEEEGGEEEERVDSGRLVVF